MIFSLENAWYYHDYIVDIYHCQSCLKLPIHAPFWGVLGHVFPRWRHPSSWPPKGPSLDGNTLFEPFSVRISATWARDEEKNCLQLLCLRVLCAACPIVCPHYTQAPAKASNDCGRSLLSSFYVILKMLNRNDEANMITKSSFIISFNIFITRRMLVIIFFKYGVLPRIQSTEVAYFWSRPDWVARSRWLSPATQST